MRKAFLFLTFILVRALHPLVIQASKTQGQLLYDKTSVVIMETLVTLVGMGGVTLYQWQPALVTPTTFKALSIIGGLYALGDYLEMLSMGSLSGAAYQILLQMKLLITAILLEVTFGQKQSLLQWNLLVLIVLGMAAYMIAGSSDSSETQASWGALLFVGAKVMVSCLAGVQTDTVMKELSLPFYAQIFQTKFAWLMVMLVCRGSPEMGLLENWDWTTWLVLLSFTLKGWLTLYLLKNLNSIFKNIGEALSVLVVYLAEILLPVFPAQYSTQSMIQALLVVFAVLAYVQAGHQPPKKVHAKPL